MNQLIFIPKHQFNLKIIRATLIVLAIISNVHFTKCNQNELEFDLIKEGSIPVFKYKNLVQNIAQADDQLVVAGLNYIYLMKDEFYKSSNYFKKAFFSLPKNQHLSFSEFKKPSLILQDYLPTNQFRTNCSSISEHCKSTNHTDNLNKILIKTASNPPFLIVCGTAYAGQCFLSVINEKKLLLKDSFTDDRFNFLASQNSSLLIPIFQQGVFIHTFEPDGRNSSTRPPLVSKLKFERLIGPNKQTQFSFKPIVHGPQKTVINIQDNDILNKFKFNFIYGFIYKNYAFVLKRELKDNHKLETRLARVCLDDSSFFSYTEIPLSCKDENLTDEFTYASSAHFGQADTYLTKKTDIKLMNNTLFVTFNNYDNRLKKVNKSNGSVLCAFTIESLNEFYSHAINLCYDGLVSETVGLMTQYSVINKQTNTCSKVGRGENYLCYGNSINSYVEYRDRLKGYHLYTFKQDIITSLATSGLHLREKNEVLNIFVLGTEEGRLYKLIRTYDDELVLTHSFKIDNHLTDPINSNPLINDNSKNVYFTSGKHMIKYPLNSCSIYSNCNQCLKALDNLKCGWCSIENQNSGGCLNKEECTQLGKDVNFKTSFALNMCPPIIEDFLPKTGPLEGNTIIEIKGENLCNPSRDQRSQIPNYKVNVTIGKHWCEPESCTDESLKCKTTKMTSASSDPLKVCTVDRGSLGYDIDGCSVSLTKFNYTKTEVFKLEPNYGPIGGGTKVTLIGYNLNSGTNRIIKIKESYCEEIKVNNTHLECLTKGIQIDNEDKEIIKRINQDGKIILEIDENKYVLDDVNKPDVKFEFKPNPTVTKYYPKAGLRNSPINITIEGKYFDSAHSLKLKTTMYTVYSQDNKIFFSNKCIKVNNSTLNCTLPSVPEDIKIKSSQSPLEAEIILISDDDLNKSKIQSNIINFFYYPLPKFELTFPKIHKVSIDNNKKGYVELRGENLSDHYPFAVKVTQLQKDVTNETKIEDLKTRGKSLYCKEKRVIDFHIIKCQIDFSGETISKDFLESVWLVSVEMENQKLIDAKLVKLQFDEASLSKLMLFGWISIFLILAIALVTYYLYKTKRIEFTKGKQFPHFTITYNSSPLMGNQQTMLNSRFIRQSSQNDLTNDIKLPYKHQSKEDYKIRLAQDNILIPESCLKIIKEIGKGYFGCVFKGELNLPSKDRIFVAVKTLRNTSNENSEPFKSLIEEAFLMKDFKHENVLTLIGVCLKEDSLPMIVLPFMANGDLLTYIRCETNEPTVKDLLYYGIDVGKGMSYLSSLKYVHRDLAARNCMMDENFRIKVADFGLTRDVYERNYYTSQHRSEIPIKWLAPESIEKYLTTTESDVWSYGILLWELLTRGNIPYPGYEGYQILEFVKSNKRMQKPTTCPDEIYELMLDCWQINPKARPTFDEIVERIQLLIKSKEQEVNVYSNLSVNYASYPIEEYYNSINQKRQIERASISSSPYYNSTLSIGPTSPKATINPINTSPFKINNGNSLSNQAATLNRMSTFKVQSPTSKIIEMPNQQISLTNLNNNDNIYNNDETIKLYNKNKTIIKEPSNEDETPLQNSENSRKNSLNSISTHSNLSFKLQLNRQNAIDLNEADTRNYEYVVQTPQILFDRKESTNDTDENELNNDNNSIDLQYLNKTDNYVNPVKYFK